MTGVTDGRYYRSDDWRLSAGDDPFVENSRGGKIFLDAVAVRVLECIDGLTFEEIDREKLISTGLLETFLKVFTRVGVIKTGKEEIEKKAPPQPLKENPPVSVVIVNYNGEKHLPDLLDSLKSQTYKHIEVIVVDNRSTDNGCRWLKAHHPDVTLKELGRNTGFAAGVNAGIGLSRGEYILVLNNDIVLDEGAVYELVRAALSAGSQWSAIVPKMKFFDNPAFINAIGNSLYPISWGSDNFIGHVDLGQFDGVGESFSACFGAVLLNRGALADIGLLDPRYRFYYEDMDWSFRARAYGYPILTAPRADIYHKFGASMSLKSQAFKFRYIVGNRLYFTLKNLDRETVKRFLFNYVIEDIKSFLIYLKRRNISLVFAYVLGYLRFFTSLPGLIFKRRRMRKRRKEAGIEDSRIFSRAVPLNLTLMDRGSPRLDVYSLRTNYGCLDSTGGGGPGDIVIWRLRPPRNHKSSREKIYMEFGFSLPRGGHYDIYLLGMIRGGLTVYLDNRSVGMKSAEKEKSKRLRLNYLAAQNVYIPEGGHVLELSRRNHIHAVVLQKHPRGD